MHVFAVSLWQMLRDQGQTFDRSGTQENKPTDVSEMVASTRAYIIISNPDNWHCYDDWQSVAYHEDVAMSSLLSIS